MPSSSLPPPSKKSDSGGFAIYIIGFLVLGAATFGLYSFSKNRGDQPVTPQITTIVKTAEPPPLDPMAEPPPPPPKLEDMPSATPEPSAAGTGNGAGGPAGPGPCAAGKCAGESTSALRSALTARAQSARGCYNRALQKSEVSGSMTVSVMIGPGGSVCSASLTNDTVHSGEVSSCVLGRFRGGNFPPPSGGCVTANIPITFTIKQ